eukprot:m.217303 g.217303  ORF g.217303 m.217303 type:complete len:255 (+) comp18666_c2_seq4:2008-2772(+)
MACNCSCDLGDAGVGGEELVRPPNAKFFIDIGVSLGLVLLGGLMSGLTVGLFSIDEMKLKLLQWDEDASDKDRANAAKVEPLLKRHHLLLCTLLVSNAAAMEALPLFLDEIVPTWLAIVLSVTFVLLFGEILPQALCTKNPLAVGARLAMVVRFFMLILFPITWPLSKLLDWMFGSDHKTILMKRSELKALVHIHGLEGGTGGYLRWGDCVYARGGGGRYTIHLLLQTCTCDFVHSCCTQNRSKASDNTPHAHT